MSVTISEETVTTYVVRDRRGNVLRTPHRAIAEESAFALRCLYWSIDGCTGPRPQRTVPTPGDNPGTRCDK